MMQKIKRIFSWLMEKAKSGVAWVRDNRSWLQQQARQIGQQAYKILMAGSRQVWAKFNQGRALAILTVQYRQGGNPFREALEQAKAEVGSMSEAEIAYMVTEFFTGPIKTQVAHATA